MSWNHRVMRHATTSHDGSKGEFYQIHEVYYEGEKVGYTTDSVAPFGETLEELKQDFERQQKAFDKPVLDYEEGDGELRNDAD